MDNYKDYTKKFLYVVFQEADAGPVFKKSLFWNILKEGMEEVKRVWKEAKEKYLSAR